VKFSKNGTLLQNNSTSNITLNEGLAMPCANYIIMGFATNSIFTPNLLVDYLPHPKA
jgi:hypothetical protein